MRRMRLYRRAFFVAAARACQRANPEAEVVTTKMVRDHIKARALEEPIVLLIFMWVQLIGIMLLIRDSGKGEPGSCGNYDLFRSCVRILQPWFACTNAYK